MEQSLEPQPCSVYISHNNVSETTNYIITSGATEPWVARAKTRIGTYFASIEKHPGDMTDVSPTIIPEIHDPFLLQSILCHESLMEARQPITTLRHQLYDVLDVVDKYSESPFDRSNLKDITNQLHSISQNVDSLYVSAEMGTMVAEHCVRSRRKLLEVYRNRAPLKVDDPNEQASSENASLELQDTASPPDPGNFPITISGSTVAESPMQDDNQAESPSKANNEDSSVFQKRTGFADSNVGDALDYLVESLDSQKRWLQSYKSRKDIAMNLVFNLVTQQDSETSTSIALDTKDDSASMKIIAVLTMIFLPATATASFFGMNFFNCSDQGKFKSSPQVWIFVVTTCPLTLFIFLIWLYWYRIIDYLRERRWIR
ncbi:hypothetical protein IL306_007122 [Fusarium sp. DS 682]|nr:hypothetical protein IL306_007122 [Fusarium sp. DS 682]